MIKVNFLLGLGIVGLVCLIAIQPASILPNNLAFPQGATTSGWVSVGTGTTEDLKAIDFVDANNGWVVGTYGTIRYTNNGGLTWSNQSKFGLTDNFNSVDFLNTTYGVVTGQSEVLLTTNGGSTWSDITPFLYGGPYGKIQIFNDPVKNLVGGWINQGSYLYTARNIASTTNWTQMSLSTSLGSIYFLNMTYGWVTGQDGVPHGVVQYTTNGGISWIPVTVPNSKIIYSADFLNATFGYANGLNATNYCTLFQTTNGGVTWSTMQTNIDGNLVFDGELAFVNATCGWAVTDFIGIFYTTNGGTTWIGEGPTNINMQNIFALNGATAWVCCTGGTIYYTTNSGLDVSTSTTGSTTGTSSPTTTTSSPTTSSQPAITITINGFDLGLIAVLSVFGILFIKRKSKQFS